MEKHFFEPSWPIRIYCFFDSGLWRERREGLGCLTSSYFFDFGGFDGFGLEGEKREEGCKIS